MRRLFPSDSESQSRCSGSMLIRSLVFNRESYRAGIRLRVRLNKLRMFLKLGNRPTWNHTDAFYRAATRYIKSRTQACELGYQTESIFISVWKSHKTQSFFEIVPAIDFVESHHFNGINFCGTCAVNTSQSVLAN